MLKKLLAVAAVALMPFAASAVTIVDDGDTVDITSDTLFLGFVEGTGAGGTETVNFFSEFDTKGTFELSITAGNLSVWSDLVVQWVNTNTSAVISEIDPVIAGTNLLMTVFLDPDLLEQSLVISWSDSTDGTSFDYEISSIPVPAAGLLLLGGLGALAAVRSKKKS